MEANVFRFRDARSAPDPVLEAGPVAFGSQPVPLVLDNGSFQARAGWACPGPDPGPEPRLQFRAPAPRTWRPNSARVPLRKVTTLVPVE